MSAPGIALMAEEASGFDEWPAEALEQAEVDLSPAPSAEPYDNGLWRYRERTMALLRRYMRISVETGRLPSLLGREFFRTRVTAYHVSTFEDAVIFVHDIERCLEQLDRFKQEMLAKVVLQEYSQWEAAHLLGCTLRTLERCFPDAVDSLTRIFLRSGILERLETSAAKTCQEGKTVENFASGCNDGE
jgi:DNA-directed RNA polymerase specialized sigma24 family protein